MTDYTSRTDVVVRGLSRVISQFRGNGLRSGLAPQPMIMRLTQPAISLHVCSPFYLQPNSTYPDDSRFETITEQVWHFSDEMPNLVGTTTIKQTISAGGNGICTAPFTIIAKVRVNNISNFYLNPITATRKAGDVFQYNKNQAVPSRGIEIIPAGGTWSIAVNGSLITGLAFGSSISVAYSVNGSNAYTKVQGLSVSGGDHGGMPNYNIGRAYFGDYSASPTSSGFPNASGQKALDFANLLEWHHFSSAMTPSELDDVVAWLVAGNTVVC